MLSDSSTGSLCGLIVGVVFNFIKGVVNDIFMVLSFNYFLFSFGSLNICSNVDGGLISVFAYSSFTKVSIIFVLKYVFYDYANFRFV